MVRLLRIFFLLNSTLLLLTDCSYNTLHRAKTTDTQTLISALIHPVIPENRTSVKYKTEMNVLNKNFTGIAVLKQTDSLTKHCVFVTELGMRMFDFVIRGDSVKADFVFDALNKPAFVNLLISSFRDMLLVSVLQKTCEKKSNKNGIFYWVKDSENSLAVWKETNTFVNTLKIYAGKKKHAVIHYTNNYDTIKFKKYGLLKLKIELTRIEEENK